MLEESIKQKEVGGHKECIIGEESIFNPAPKVIQYNNRPVLYQGWRLFEKIYVNLLGFKASEPYQNIFGQLAIKVEPLDEKEKEEVKKLLEEEVGEQVKRIFN